MTTRHQWIVWCLVLVAVVPAKFAFAQGDGPRTHWKEMLTDTNIFSLTYMHASGNANPLDPTHTNLPGADFSADLTLVGYSQSFSLFDRTAIGTFLLPVGEMQGTTTGPVSSSGSARGYGDPILQLDLNLIGAPAMVNMPDLLRYEPDFTLDLVLTLAIPIGEYHNDSPANIGQNRWYGRVGLPVMINLGDWVPGQRTTLEFLPAVWFFDDNDDFLGLTVENEPLFQLEGHLTRDFTEEFWASFDAVYYLGGKSTIGGLTGKSLDELAVGFTFGYKINNNMTLTAGFTATVDDGMDDLDMGVFHINLIYGWHQLLEGIDRLGGG
ncbi:MAG: transporter [Planctomycetes bacterium]|nr:transporter [Planctomycetota bacterium]